MSIQQENEQISWKYEVYNSIMHWHVFNNAGCFLLLTKHEFSIFQLYIDGDQYLRLKYASSVWLQTMKIYYCVKSIGSFNAISSLRFLIWIQFDL
jgi:hypothetical protein